MTRWQMRMVCVSSAVGVLVGLSGCGDKEPIPSASETANVQVLSANPEPSRDRPVLEPPEPPAALDDPGHDGAVAAAEYFYRLSVYAAASGDTTELEAVSGEECASCSDYVARIKNFYDSGGYWTTMPEIEVYDSNDLQREEESQSACRCTGFSYKELSVRERRWRIAFGKCGRQDHGIRRHLF